MIRWTVGVVLLFTTVLFQATLFAAVANAQDLAIVNAHIVDPTSRSVSDGTLLIRDGRIAAVGADVAVPADFEILDAAGGWVIPGLFDLHTHSFGNFAPDGSGQMLGALGVARVALYAGVVGFLDLFSMEDVILGQRDRQRSGEGGGADIFAAGPCLTATDGHCSEYGVPTRLIDSPAEARTQIAELALKNPDVVKLVYDNEVYGSNSRPTVDRATMTAVVEAAHDHGLKAVLHVGTWQDVQDAVEAGADAVTHTPGPEPIPDGLASLMAERGTLHIPTLAVQSELGRIADDPALLDRPLLGEVVAENVIEGYRERDAWPETMNNFLEWGRPLRSANLEAVGILSRAGVRMATGTDGGNPGIFQGYSVHREMELLVEAGLTEWEALTAATTAPAHFLGQDWGVHVGAEATLVVLGGSPLESITNTQLIQAVVQRGSVVDRSAVR